MSNDPTLPPDSGDLQPTIDSHAAEADTTPSQAEYHPATEIGPYRLLQRIGVGGMGEVWSAEQLRPVRRRVAVKIIKRGMDTREVVVRFEAERQALALMNHPNVAQVFDAGETPRGRPYFAMELVKGIPISAYCDRHRLATRERLELMIQVCEGVQHAHQKGVIHRDLKPSNILVTVEEGGGPRPKIIDFGVAKATHQHLTEMTLFTQLGQLVGTPEYMSPEQAEMSGEDVDTRTDVYSLGVVLYQLLTGTLPFDSKELRKAGLYEIQRRIREEDPPRPSTRVSSLGNDRGEIAKQRQTLGGALARCLKGDLDWIVMRALEKDRLRRYDSPRELADDLRRHLHDEPIVAASPSVGYRARKFVKRHRAGVVAAAVLMLALLVGVAGLTGGLMRARQAEQEALVERDRAQQSSRELGEVVQFMVDLFEVANPENGEGQDMTAREILDQGANRLRTDLRGQPLVRARLYNTLGEVYESLGLYGASLEHKSESLEILRKEKGADSPAVAEAYLGLATVEYFRANYAASEQAAQAALDIYRKHHSGDHVNVSRALRAVAVARSAGGDPAAAEPMYREALEMLRRLPGVDPATLEAQVRGLANVLNSFDRHEEAEALYQESLALTRQIHEGDHLMVAYALDNLAIHYDFSGNREKAEPLYREALAMLRRIYDGDHPEVAQTMGNLAGFLIAWLDPRDVNAEAVLAEAEALYRGAIDMHQRYRPGHPMIGDDLGGLATIESLRGNQEAARDYWEQAIAVYQMKLDSGHPKLVDGQLGLAGTLLDLKRGAEAESLLQGILDGLGDQATQDRRYQVEAYLLEAYRMQGREEEAEQLAARLPEKFLPQE